MRGHSSLVLSVAFDPIGKRVVTASQDRTARIWEAASGAPLAVLKGHEGAVFSAAFSSDGRRVVTGSFDKTLRLWDAETGRQLGSPIDAGKPILAVTLTSDDRYLVTSLLDEPTTARPFGTSTAVWDVRTGERASVKDAGSLRLANYLVDYSQNDGILFSKGIAMLPTNRDTIRNIVGSAGREGVLYGVAGRHGPHVASAPSGPYRLVRYAREVELAKLPPELRSLSQGECRELGLSSARPAGWIEAGLQHLSNAVGGENKACAKLDGP